MQRKILSIILALNMAAGLVLTTYAAEQEMPQTETFSESDDQITEEYAGESSVDGETCIKTETEASETSTEILTETTETEIVETDGTETEFTTETETTEETETEAETVDGVATETAVEMEDVEKTEAITETEVIAETKTENETEVVTETEVESEAITQSETDTEEKTLDETETQMEDAAIIETETEEIVDEKMAAKPVIYSVAFPSIDEFRFVLDPYGLTALPDGKSATLEALKPYAGKIYCNNKMMVTNKSSVPVKVKVSIQLTGDIHSVNTVGDVEADTENNVLLYLIPAQNDLEGNLDNYQKSNTGIVVKKDEPTVLEFVLPESSYLEKGSADGESIAYGIADGDTGHSAAFQIAGFVNTKADWKTFNEDGKKVGLRINYSYEDASNQPIAYSRSCGAFALLPYDGDTVDLADAE